MDDLKKHLEQQKKMNEELDTILHELDELEKEEKRLLYDEHQRLLDKVNQLQTSNVKKIDNRLEALNKRLDKLASQSEGIKDVAFFNDIKGMRYKISEIDESIRQITSFVEEKEEAFRDEILFDDFPLVNKGPIEPIMKKTTTVKSKTNKNSGNHKDRFANAEFNIGSNVLNIIGVILVLISLIIFGKYIYSNLFSNALKGIFLFVISVAVLATGELMFKPKLPKYAEGISSLGISSLYASLMINYLVLNTLSGLGAIFVSLIITCVSLFISKQNNSNIIRIISLLGGYGCLFPLEFLSGVQSYITVFILCLISITNLLMPIDKDDDVFDFGKYSIIINIAFMFAFLATDNLESVAQLMYLVISFATIASYYCLSDYQSYKTLFIASLIIYGLTFGEFVLPAYFMYFVISSACFCATKEKNVSNVFIALAMLSLAVLTDIFGFEFLFIVLAIYVVTSLSVLFLVKLNGIYLKIVTVFLMGLSYILTIFLANDIVTLLGLVLLGFGIWYLAEYYKEDSFFFAFKYIYLLSCIAYFNDILRYPLDYSAISFTLSFAFVFIFILLNTFNDRFKVKDYKANNEKLIYLCITLNTFKWEQNILGYMLMVLVTFGLVYLMTNPTYVNNPLIQKKKYKIYAESIIFESFVLFTFVVNHLSVSNLLFSITLMIIASVCIWFGFYISDPDLRKLGLGLALFVAAKLIFFDLSSAEFILKAILFFIVGIASLTISYYYSKYDKDHKDKK